MATAAVPEFLSGRINLPGGLDVGVYRLFLIVIGLTLAFALQWMTWFGHSCARIGGQPPGRARRRHRCGPGVFVLTFALGSALAGLGSALAVKCWALIRAFRSSTSFIS